MAPGEIKKITGEQTEVQPVAGPSAKFEIVNTQENVSWNDKTVKRRLVTQGGDYSAIFNVTLQQPNVPHVRIELETDNGPFTVGQPGARVLDAATTADDPNAHSTSGVPSIMDPSKRNYVPLFNMVGKAAVESIREFNSLLGLAEPKLLALDGTPRVVYFAPYDVSRNQVADWIRLVDLSNSKNTKDTEDVAVKTELAALRRLLLGHLATQSELRLTELLLDDLVSHEQGANKEGDGQLSDKELDEATLAALRRYAADKLHELRSDAQRVAIDVDLKGKMETAKSEKIVTAHPLKYVSSLKAQSIILNTSKLFGIFPEMPSSDIRTNMLIIEKNGREKYFACLAATIDRLSQEDAMSFDERIELWKDRLLLLAMLKVAVGDNNSVDANATTPSRSRCNVELIEFDCLKLEQLGIDLDLGELDTQAAPFPLENAESFRTMVESLEKRGLAEKVSSLSKKIASGQSGTMRAKVELREFNLSLQPRIKLNSYSADLEIQVTRPDLTRPGATQTRSIEFDCEGKLDEPLAMNVTNLFGDESKSKRVILLLTIKERSNE